jgi:hypothetical protein
MNRRRLFLVAVALLLWQSSQLGVAAAQEVEIAGLRATAEGPMLVAPPRLEQPKWGTTGQGVRTVHALGFEESISGTTFDYSPTTTQRYRTGGTGFWFDFALSDLPAGALITGIELDGCDTNATQHATAILFRKTPPPGVVFTVGSVGTSNAATPGCALFGGPDNLPGTHVVDNVANVYFLRVELTGSNETTSFGAVRIYYRLQVSPAPGVATFTDVPTGHPFFRFVEALVASGITAGCGGGNFCVNNPITRGEMAVFLAAALGLHFPF